MWAWINLICGVVFFCCVPGILFTIPTENVYLTTGLHAVVFVIVHHTLNDYLKTNFGIEEPRS
jgi:general stress protein CsbA